MSNPFLKTQRTENFGGRVMISQQQNSHQARLNAIYRRPLKTEVRKGNQYQKPRQPTKKEIYEGREHERNVRSLVEFLSHPKKMSDRYKDPNDFFVYPALFFRQQEHIVTSPRMTKPKKKTKKLKFPSEESDSNRKYGIDVGVVSQQLPYLAEFNQEQIEQYADAITRLIFNYNLNSPQRLIYLKACVKRTVPQAYPSDFMEIIDEIFSEIGQSLGILIP